MIVVSLNVMEELRSAGFIVPPGELTAAGEEALRQLPIVGLSHAANVALVEISAEQTRRMVRRFNEWQP